MMTVIPFQAQHLYAIQVQQAQAHEAKLVRYDHLEWMESQGNGFTGIAGSEVIACGGIVVNPMGIGHLWSYLSPGVGRHMIQFTRICKRIIAATPARRLEASARVDFGAGCRWLTLLGFQIEGTMRRFDVDGADHYLYSKVSS